MAKRSALPVLLLILLAVGCSTRPQPVVPTAASLPTITPSPTPTDAPMPVQMTWTPSPVPVLSCSQVVEQVSRQAQAVCGGTGVGEACFVAPRVALELRPVTGQPAFSEPGHLVQQSLFRCITTAPYDSAAKTWGMAILRVGRGAVLVPSDATTILLYGDATVYDADSSMGPYSAINVLTGFADPWCDEGPLPGVLLQTGLNLADEIVVNSLTLRFRGTVLVRAPAQAWMELAVLNGEAEIETPDGRIDLPAGTQLHTVLGGKSGFEPVGAIAVQPLSDENVAYLPTIALPRVLAAAMPLMATADVISSVEEIQRPATAAPEATEASYAPFAVTPQGGVYFSYQGKRIQPGERVTGVVPQGGSDSWAFTPVGVGPESIDSFEVIATGDWDPILVIESATFGMLEAEFDRLSGREEVYRRSLAGSGGDWRITIRDVDGGGGGYLIRYTCLGPCEEVAP